MDRLSGSKKHDEIVTRDTKNFKDFSNEEWGILTLKY